MSRPSSGYRPPGSATPERPDDQHFDSNAAMLANGRIEMDQDEVDAIIRNKRKVRDPKACYACHRRKVKCDRNLPCDSCVKRDHPELCSYERPSKKKRLALNNNMPHQPDGIAVEGQDVSLSSGPNVTVPKEQWDRINAELQRLKAAVKGAQISDRDHSNNHRNEAEPEEPQSRSDFTEREGIHAPSNQMGTMHLGSRSVLAYMMGDKSKSSQDAARVLLEENILPNLGLDNETATYPFVDLWSTESSIQDVSGLCGALPEDALCREFWTAYRDVACTIYPVVPDTTAFDNTLNYLLRQRSEQAQQGIEIDATKPYGVSMPWLALLFAVLASGAQSTDRTSKERELTSQVYICCSYQALRMANFLSHACLETIEACLIIGNALAYNMNPGVAYIFLGMTLRSALSIGLHVKSQSFSEHENYIRGRIWWALAWQDSHFSVSYDRPSSSILCFPDIPYMKSSAPGRRSYVETMSAMIRFTQQILRDRTLNPKGAMTWTAIQQYRDEISAIIADATPRLRDRTLCNGTAEHLERLAFQLHSSYMISEICRPALKEQSNGEVPSATPVSSPNAGRRKSSMSAFSPSSTNTDPSILVHLRAECVTNLERAVSAYVEIHEHSIFAARSWIGIQRCISAAFLLGIIPETRQEPRITHLLTKLEARIAARAAEEVEFDSSFDADGLNSPMMNHTTRRLSVVNNGGSRPGMGETPNWARSMSKTLHALRKLNAALAGTKMSKTPHGYLNSTFATNASKYATPVVSPVAGSTQMGGSSNASMPIANAVNQYPPPTSGSHSHMQQQQQHHHHHQHSGMNIASTNSDSYSPIGHSNTSSYSLTSAGIQRPNSGNGINMALGLAPVTPDSASVSSGTSGNDWHCGNLAERALEYVQPGLWG